MPMYEYVCTGCGSRCERTRPIAQRDIGMACDLCGADCEQNAYPDRTLIPGLDEASQQLRRRALKARIRNRNRRSVTHA